MAPARKFLVLLKAIALVGGFMALLAAGLGGSASRLPAASATACEAPRAGGSSDTAGAGGLMVGRSLDQMTDESEAVIVGTVTGFQTCREDGIVTHVTVRPLAALKGEASGPVSIAVPGGDYGGLRLAVGTSPEFSAGERVIAFLGRASGSYFPIEGFQSKLTVAGDGTVSGVEEPLSIAALKVARAASGGFAAGQDPLGGAGLVQESASFATLNSQFWTSDIPVPVNINAESGIPSQLSPVDVRKASLDAFHAWQQLPDSYIAFGPFNTTARVSTQADCDGLYDTTWGISNPNHGAGTLAVTYTCYDPSSGHTLDADVEIDTDHFSANWRTDGSGNCDGYYDLQTVLTHEYGHLLGLGHPSANGGCSSCPVMDASYGGIQHTPCPDDAAGAAGLYPAAPGSPPPAPGGLSVSANGGDPLLSWSDVGGEMGYEVWRAASACGPATTFELYDSVAANIVTFTDLNHGDPPGDTFCYEIRAFNESGDSAPSQPAGTGGASTPTPTPPPTPTQAVTPSPALSTPTPTPAVTPSPAPSTPAPTESSASTQTPTPQATGTPAATGTASPTPTHPSTPTPSSIPAPTPSAAPTAPTSPHPSPTHLIQVGDVDCDNDVDSIDALLILRSVAGTAFATGCMDHADVDCDSDIDSVDALRLLRYVAQLPTNAPGDCPPVGAQTAGPTASFDTMAAWWARLRF